MTDVGRKVELRDVARSHHVHYSVEPEVLVREGERLKVGFEIRLWAVHSKGARALPGCEKCQDLAAELRRIAEWVLPSEVRPTRSEIEWFQPELYESKLVPGADEVALGIRLIHREGYDRPIDACEERCLKEAQARLKELGIPERD